jgi:endonuclease/exonuclease/phosphatase family metal-dependent hydrolase
MTRAFAFLVLAAAPFLASANSPKLPDPLPEPNRAERVLRFVSWNILGGRGPDNSHPHEGLAEIIRILRPDAIALQEVDVKTTRARGADLPARLAELTGLKAAFAEAMPFQGGSYGEAILTRLAITREHRSSLPAPDGFEPRALLALELKAPFGSQPILFAATHLDHLKDSIRTSQTNAILQFFRQQPQTMPAILAGDWNASPQDASLAPLVNSWKICWPDKAPPTWPAINPKEAIDHLFCHPQASWKILSARRGDLIFPDSPAWKARLEALSDHLPVVVETSLAE